MFSARHPSRTFDHFSRINKLRIPASIRAAL